MGRYFKPAARAAGIPELTFHDLRHTGASLMIAAGCHVKTIAEQMGHADGGGLVLQRYGHLYKRGPPTGRNRHRIARFCRT
jgi:integrase